MKTINLKWKLYAPVAERIKEAHTQNEKISFLTELTWIWDKGWLQVKAYIRTDKWEFNWHSFWIYKSDKDVEKLETVAVWRALAFAGYLADWEIASYEEMESFIKKEEVKQEVVKESKPVQKLQSIWLCQECQAEINEAVKLFCEQKNDKGYYKFWTKTDPKYLCWDCQKKFWKDIMWKKKATVTPAEELDEEWNW